MGVGVGEVVKMAGASDGEVVGEAGVDVFAADIEAAVAMVV